ncbi:MAG: DEAD/DEAH box helicase family protein [Anaerolineales bacterium]|nr:DEAD/DEAH box helicase family protein [Anaerolineales bacterium]
MGFQSVIEKYRKISFSERDKGARFERLMQAYLQTDPYYANRFKKIWLWGEFPYRKDLGGSDTGIDLVAQTNEGDYWAIQCKRYQEETRINKDEVDSFLATSSRTFKNEQMQTVGFVHRLWISTTRHWGSNAEEAIHNQNPPVSRISLFELTEAPVDWDKLEQGVHGEKARTTKKSLLPHQKDALEQAHEYFKKNERGKLIMACGTGKTFTSLRIAEHETNGKGAILFLVPSIALLGQALREWSADAKEDINAICICSDPEVSKQRKKQEDVDALSVVDLALPASTDPKKILEQFMAAKRKSGMTVVFSTYQSIDVIAKAQKVLLKNGFKEFDLIICDEAHRTTGATLAGEDEKDFVKVHNPKFIQAKKRMYMTATPRLYSDEAKSKAAQADAVLASMDDANLYGDEIYRIGFGEAVERGLLSDYKVLILTLSDKDVPLAVQQMVSADSEINADDLSKLVGCVNALSKQFIGDDGKTKEVDPEPMRRAVAFCPSIAASKKIMSLFNQLSDVYLNALAPEKKRDMVVVESQHMDGTMAAPKREEGLRWVKEATEGNACRILTNVRVLSEGVDVPSLDAVMFLSAKNSQVDVVQSVGRVMRRSPGKKYGYIIIPVVVPADVEPEQALNDNKRYKVIWDVLNALRAHDERFNATVNKIELNKNRPSQINVVGLGEPSQKDGEEAGSYQSASQKIARQMELQFEQLQSVVFARLVQKVGDRRYWEQWAKDVAQIAERQKERIEYLIAHRKNQKAAFAEFVTGLQRSINPSITQAQAVDMLAQHIITKPIFEALFEGYSFVKHNAVSHAMQNMLDALEEKSLPEDSETLQRFYESVRKRAAGIDNADGKQRIIIELYDKFFKTAFPKMVEQLGIVYTPVEAVDFIIHSVDDLLKQEFGRGLTDEGVHILDPFTGTGTFITRLLQSGLIRDKDLERKYKHELHANEIVLLAYYIAAVNIENAYHDATPTPSVLADISPKYDGTSVVFGGDREGVEYSPFEGIVLTDTFQLGETGVKNAQASEMFVKNSARALKQKKAPLRVIIGNPPYSVGQRSANDNAANQEYSFLDSRIAETYVANSITTMNKANYDAYIKAFRWSSDRLDTKTGGVIAFISNGAWLDGNTTSGFRKCIEKEFSSIWVFNLRGNQRTSGELSRREGGKLFGSGSRTPIAITFLVKNPAVKTTRANIYYRDIGDYLSREEKLAIIHKLKSVTNSEMKWKKLKPNEHGDWLNQRNDSFSEFIPLADKSTKEPCFFISNSNGIVTNRDAWVYNSSLGKLSQNMKAMISFYNSETKKFIEAQKKTKNLKVEDFVSTDPTRIKWVQNLFRDAQNGVELQFDKTEIINSSYRPFFKQKLYKHRNLVWSPYLQNSYFPNAELPNRVISITGIGASKEFSVLMTDFMPNLHYLDTMQSVPLYYYEEQDKQSPTLWDYASEDKSDYIRRDGVSDFILERAKKQYGVSTRSTTALGKEDIFYYVYGILHSPEYRAAFANDLKKQLPRLPLVENVKDFWAFSKAGRKLAELHVHYEQVPPAAGVLVHYNRVPQSEIEKGLSGKGMKSVNYRVEKMRFPAKGQKDAIIYNSQITVTNIPAKAYEYVVNGKSAIEWVMERYQVTTHKESGIVNDPNDWAEEVGDPKYILDLLLSVINVSVQTVEIVESLPRVKFE